MKLPIYLLNGEEVIVWGEESRGSEQLRVTYSYLRPNGKIGHRRTRTIFEDDFLEVFKGAGKAAQLSWQTYLTERK